MALIRLNCHFLWFPPKLSLIISTCIVFIVAAARVQLAGNCCTVSQGRLFLALSVVWLLSINTSVWRVPEGAERHRPLLQPILPGAAGAVNFQAWHWEPSHCTEQVPMVELVPFGGGTQLKPRGCNGRQSRTYCDWVERSVLGDWKWRDFTRNSQSKCTLRPVQPAG